jgi:hypothetical protein
VGRIVLPLGLVSVSNCHALTAAISALCVILAPGACLGIRSVVGCALIIPMIIQTIRLEPSGAVWTDGAPNVSRPDPSQAIQADAEQPSRNRKVVDFFGIGGTNDRPPRRAPGTRKEFAHLPDLASPGHRGETAP